uniref:Protein kinase domain-containing protein n=1 Tax=Heterorhabditis bacteriophora TaxID=37862 RepID=A0A1I7WXF8_HETBA
MVVATQPESKLKYVSLVVLIVQTTALVLVLRYSRTQVSYIYSLILYILKYYQFYNSIYHNVRIDLIRFVLLFKKLIFVTDGPKYLSSTAVVMAEIVAVPAVLYVIQNNLLFLALSKLDAASYQVTYQLKILTTAFFSVTMLGRVLNRLKWLALILLTAGVALVQMPSSNSSSKSVTSNSSDNLIGVLAVLTACVSSGFAGVYFEKILKTSSVSLWMRNFQLAFFSIFGGLFMCWLYAKCGFVIFFEYFKVFIINNINFTPSLSVVHLRIINRRKISPHFRYSWSVYLLYFQYMLVFLSMCYNYLQSSFSGLLINIFWNLMWFQCVETLTRTHLVLEYAGGGELYIYVHEKGKLTESEAKPLFAQIVCAVSHMVKIITLFFCYRHSRGIIHRDIKAENVMFSAPGVVKLVDFGFSCMVPSTSEQLSTFCGSPPYAAPELFRLAFNLIINFNIYNYLC